MKSLFVALALCASAYSATMQQNGASPSTIVSDINGQAIAPASIATTGNTTIGGNSFSVGVTTFVVVGGLVGIGTASPCSTCTAQVVGGVSITGNASIAGSVDTSGNTQFNGIPQVNSAIAMRFLNSANDNFATIRNPGGAGTTAIAINQGGGDVYLSTTPAATQLFYCNGGTFTGNVCRGAACICTGGSASGLGIYVK